MLTQFLRDENGSATVEWVVMTAASVAMGLAVMSYVRDGIEDLSNDIRSSLSNISIKTSFEDWDAFRANAAAEAEAQAQTGSDAPIN